MAKRRVVCAALSALSFATGALGRPAAPPLSAARMFVENVYGGYRQLHGEEAGPDFLGRNAGRVFSPRMIALIRRDERMTKPGYVGALDGDPICDCQDWGDIKAEVSVTSAGPNRAEAIVRFTNLGERRTSRLELVVVRGAWRIDNIHSEGFPDLAGYLRKHAGGR